MQTNQGMSRYVLRDGDCYWVKPLDMRPSDIDCTEMDGAEFMAFFFGHRKAVNTGERNARTFQHEQPQAE